MLGAALVPGGRSALADPISDFYKGKQLRLIVGAAVGGVYDNYARLLSRHFGRHIPGNPTVIVQFMPGAGSVQASNYVVNIAPQDGTFLLNPLNSLPLVKVLGQVTTPNIEPAAFNWIGNMTADVGDVIVSTNSQVKTIEDAKRIEVTMGATSPLALGGFYPKVMNRIIGTKFKIVTGYVGTANVELAIERGEVEGQAGGTWFNGQGTDYEWYRAGKIRVLVQIGYKAPDLPGVPLLTELASNEDDRRLLELFSSPFLIGKPTAVGPNVPPDRVAALRLAYKAMMSDPAFLADAEKLGSTIEPTLGEDLTNLVKRVMGLSEELVQRARTAVQ
jgi:hypothetical protein